MPRAPRTTRKLAPGVYAILQGRTRIAVRAFVRVRGTLYTHWMPPETPTVKAREWQEDKRVEIRRAPAPVRDTPEPSGFASDAADYLKAVAAMPSYSDRKRDIDRWIEVFSDTPRSAITAVQVGEQLAAWKNAKLAASTVNHRRTALLHLWRTLDGKGAENPVEDIPKYPEPAAEARGLPYAAVRAIFAAMGDTLTRARLEVIAYTGLPHSSISRLTAKDVDLKAGVMIRPDRKKGRGTTRQAVPLTTDAIRALKRLQALGGLGKTFSRSSLHKSFRLACDKAQKATGTDLSGVRPYDLRHSYGTEVYRLTGDERAVQMILGHARIETTHRYTLGGVDARLRAAVAAFDGPKLHPPVTPPRKHRKKAR